MNSLVNPRAAAVLLGDRRCTATNKSGERCGRSSALGQFVCDRHGAKAPMSIQAARERLQTLVEPAMDVLYRATRNAPPCEVCGRSDADRDPTAVRAAGMILDRCGFGPHATMEFLRGGASPFDGLTLAELADRAERLALDARAAADAERGDAIDGVVLEDDDVAAAGDAAVAFVNSPRGIDHKDG